MAAAPIPMRNNPTGRSDIDFCPFAALNLEHSLSYAQDFIDDTFCDAALKAHPDLGGTDDAYVRIKRARDCVKEYCRGVYDRLPRCDSCLSAFGVSPEESHDGWWCSLCKGPVEGRLEVRTRHLEMHLLPPDPEWFALDLRALAAYVDRQEFQECPVCYVRMAAKRLRLHLTIGHGIVACRYCPKSEDGTEWRIHLQSAHRTSICGECQQYYQEDRLPIHLQQEHSYEACTSCPKAVPPGSLEEHITEQHGNICCCFCRERQYFPTQAALRQHVSRNHREENKAAKKKWKCPDCGDEVWTWYKKRHRREKHKIAE